MEQVLTRPLAGGLHAPCGRPRRLALDNAATIFPSTLSKNQHHLFRLSARLKEPVDPAVLQSALAATAPRFPSMAAGLRRSALGYYLKPGARPMQVQPESAGILRPMSFGELKRCCLRVLYWGSTVSVEFFHTVCDGVAGSVFLKALLAEYLEQKHRLPLPCRQGVPSRREPPLAEELADCYPRCAGETSAPRSSPKAFQLRGKALRRGRLCTLQVELDEAEVRACARTRGLTVTELLASALALSLWEEQKNQRPEHRRRPVLLAVPIDLRRVFGWNTLRNFSLSATVGLDLSQKDWTFEQACARIKQQLRAQRTPAHLASCARANVRLADLWAFRLLPRFVKDLLLKAGYALFGARCCTMSLSNLGKIDLPKELSSQVCSLSFEGDATPRTVKSCGVATYGGRLRLTFTRCVEETTVERRFAEILQSCGVTARAAAA